MGIDRKRRIKLILLAAIAYHRRKHKKNKKSMGEGFSNSS